MDKYEIRENYNRKDFGARIVDAYVIHRVTGTEKQALDALARIQEGGHPEAYLMRLSDGAQFGGGFWL